MWSVLAWYVVGVVGGRRVWCVVCVSGCGGCGEWWVVGDAWYVWVGSVAWCVRRVEHVVCVGVCEGGGCVWEGGGG